MTDEPFAGARIRAAVETLSEEHGLSENATFELKVAVTEALANAVRHGRPPVEVSLECRDAAIEVEVCDHGTYAQHSESSPEGGRGVPLMVALADEVELDCGTGWTRLRLRKRLEARDCDGRLSA
ncbi:MAG: ATP-binding protein [Actinobacteria bacterium]|nr:ATP-binding protein [Actinomycetota bacterium]